MSTTNGRSCRSAHFAAQVARIAKLCDWLFDAPRAAAGGAAAPTGRYRKHRQHLFVFLERTDVPPTNNVK